MTLKEYIKYALEKGQIEFHSFSDNSYNQCVDLANDYITKVWGLEAIIGTNAKDFPERLKSGMEFVPNTIEYLPKPGELAVWNGRVGGGAGHISVVTEKGQQTTFKSLDQNWSQKERITLEVHPYSKTSLRGFIRKKGSMSEKKVELEASKFEELVTKSSKYDKFVSEGYDSVESVLKVTSKLENELNTKDKQISAYKGEVTKRETKISELEAELEQLKAQKSTPSTEAIKEPLRMLLSLLIGGAVTYAFTELPMLQTIYGQPGAVAETLTVLAMGAIVRGIDRFAHKKGKEVENTLLTGGLFRF